MQSEPKSHLFIMRLYYALSKNLLMQFEIVSVDLKLLRLLVSAPFICFVAIRCYLPRGSLCRVINLLLTIAYWK